MQRWRKRAKYQLRLEPLCVACLKQGHVVPATIADHVEEHGGSWNAFMLGPLQSLCSPCHEEKHGRLSPAGRVSKEVDDSGYPVDPAHPFNRTRGTAAPGPAGPSRTS